MILKSHLRILGKNIAKASNDYFLFLEKLSSDKYSFPVIMNICSYKEIKEMYYLELISVNRLASLKLQKEILLFNLERTLSEL